MACGSTSSPRTGILPRKDRSPFALSKSKCANTTFSNRVGIRMIDVDEGGQSTNNPLTAVCSPVQVLVFDKLGARLVRDARRLVFQLAEVAAPRALA